MRHEHNVLCERVAFLRGRLGDIFILGEVCSEERLRTFDLFNVDAFGGVNNSN